MRILPLLIMDGVLKRITMRKSFQRWPVQNNQAPKTVIKNFCIILFEYMRHMPHISVTDFFAQKRKDLLYILNGASISKRPPLNRINFKFQQMVFNSDNQLLAVRTKCQTYREDE